MSLLSALVAIVGVAAAQQHAKLTTLADKTNAGGSSLPLGSFSLQDAFALGDDHSLVYRQGKVNSPYYGVAY